MAGFNIPDFNVNNLSFGPGILYLGVTGTTPSTDVGAIRPAAEFSMTRERIQARVGSQQLLIKQHAVVENAVLGVRGIEWKFDNLQKALGTGVIVLTQSVAGVTVDIFKFGGLLDVTDFALMFEHTRPSGKKIWIDFWRASPSTEISLAMGPDYHEFPLVFSALVSETRWDGSASSDGEKLVRIRMEQ